MIKLLLYFSFIFVALSGFSQPVCGGSFVDNGGNNNYLSNSNETTTICPSVAGNAVRVTFLSFDIEAKFDGLYIYDGSSVNFSNQIPSTEASGIGSLMAQTGAYWGNSYVPGPFTSSSPDGCLTFVFKSDASMQRSGWNATITCAPALQTTQFKLNAFFDNNANGIKDSNENYFPKGHFTTELINSGIINNINTTNGIYNFTETNTNNNYNFGFVLDAAYNNYFNVVPNFTNVPMNSSPGYSTTEINFPITATVNFSDLDVNIISFQPPRAGANYNNRIIISNFGNQTINSGLLTFTNDLATSILLTSGTVNLTATGFTFNFINLLPFETRFIDVTIGVPNIPNVSIGQLVTHSASVSTTTADANLYNNNFSITAAIVASYDPNDITESHGEKIVLSSFASNDYLNYTIRFENTGTAPATNVIITDILDAKIEENSIQIISSSNNYVLNRVANNLNFKFDNIQLPVSIANTNTGKGFISYKAKLKPAFTVGTIIPNNAKIYFDTNPAIDTNTFSTEFVTTLANTNFDNNKNCLTMYPNPAQDQVTIQYNGLDSNATIALYDLLGRILEEYATHTENGSWQLATSQYPKGIYLVVVRSNNENVMQQKLIID